ncbi:DUF4476 domain-containing protein [Flavobacterium sp.]|uniref:DUF4476 domain-containing protein n=1 Tax=Flavobacterium sp. TaxID=239 RepID=UPI00262E9A7C|nr:DUF4476 domain-containing protein [Flavobacterium sp.]
MKTKLIFLFVLFSQVYFAQTSTITTFSQEGERFYVILDGVRQNDAPSTNVQITDLKKPNYLLKIIFEDSSIPTINENVYLLDYDEKRVNVTYNIKKDKKGRYKLRVSSFDNDTEQPTEAADVVKFHETENPLPKTVKSTPKKTTETTTQTVDVNTVGVGVTTTIEESDDRVNVNMNVGGVNTTTTINESDENVNVNMNVGGVKTTTTVTTKTTAPVKPSRTIGSEEDIDTTEKPKVVKPTPKSTPKATKNCTVQMSATEFQKAKQSVEKQSFADSQLKVAKQIAAAQCLSTAQIIELINIFSFEQNKLDFAKSAYASCVDKDNYYQVNDVFSFSSSTDELTEFIENSSKK